MKRKWYVCKYAWQESAGHFLSFCVCVCLCENVCVCVTECITVDAHYKILHVLSLGQAITRKYVVFLFHTSLENVA